jgi:hypothetical protein
MGLMPAILADHNVEGHLAVLTSIWTSAEWNELWTSLDCQLYTFHNVGLAEDMPDSELWQFCQTNQMILLTGNRNADGIDSLEMASQRGNQADSLPILTFSDADRIMHDRKYAQSIADRIMDYLAGIEKLRGSRRLYVP